MPPLLDRCRLARPEDDTHNAKIYGVRFLWGVSSNIASSGKPYSQWSWYSNKVVRHLPAWKWNPNSGFWATWQYSLDTSLRRVSINTAGGLELEESTKGSGASG
ncbi:uncharacterized protein METZ01_LOCUS19690 [marine metagenome]|uniref:Uncharacterized protein n=1 Tax=marine metagenome TaxID=408172 RepID=A0A381PIJ5_9ZZZZ